VATIVSLYSDPVVANVPGDLLPPEPPVLGTIQAQQNTNIGSVPKGRTKGIFNWSAPTKNVLIGGEFLAEATGDAQVLESIYDDICTSPAAKIYEVTAYSGGSTTLSAPAYLGDKTIAVTATTDFAANDWVELDDGSNTEYAQILSVGSGVLNLKTGLRRKASWPQTTTTVKECTATLKTVATHYTIEVVTGTISLVDDAFTASNPVFIQYQTDLNDLGGYSLYRVPGSMPLASGADHGAVTGYSGCETVSEAISSSAVSYEDQLGDGYNGETWTYYLFAQDDEASPNYSLSHAVMVETLPGRPQNLTKSVGDAKVIVGWDAVGDDNLNGYNIYRCDGWTFDPSEALQVNSALITTQSFDDSVANVTNRVSEGTVPFPVNGETYTYQTEGQDTTSAWTTGTRNQKSGQSAITTAEKTA